MLYISIKHIPIISIPIKSIKRGDFASSSSKIPLVALSISFYMMGSGGLIVMDEDNCMVDEYMIARIFVKGNNQFDKRGLSEMIVSAKNFKNLDRYWLLKFERKKALLFPKQSLLLYTIQRLSVQIFSS